MRHVSQRNRSSVPSMDENVAQRVDVFPEVPGITDPHWVPFTSFDSRCDVLASDRDLNDVLNIADRNSTSGGSVTVDLYLQIWSACDLLCIKVHCPGHVVEHLFDFSGFVLNDLQVLTEDLHT